jgi:hypothetical protein
MDDGSVVTEVAAFDGLWQYQTLVMSPHSLDGIMISGAVAASQLA